MSRLSARLNTVYENLIPHLDVWDFCCDHGYLGTAAYLSKNFKSVYYVDPVNSIMQELEDKFFKYVYTNENPTTVKFISKQGQQIEDPILGTVCIVGVGGLLIYEILEALAVKKILNANRLILGPHRDDIKLLSLMRENVFLNDYSLSFKKEVAENGRIRTIFIYDRRTD